ncbi:O-antigen ligase family protein [Neolewinella litorea]|uniref:O-antigen ligase domain-containing protein n=1 Tax=Neolewinella litorea TaxID=2562452 RepID=A0A4S4N7P7_9BACT|nr:O-antigen ligase family protein [Neolewinella litorea]THH34565.1 O-antigen ligase domain-containing protein [Neolewinella litorea]
MRKAIHYPVTTILYFIAVAFTVLNLGASFLGIPNVAFLSLFILTINYLFWRTFSLQLHNKVSAFILFLTPLLLLNITLSIEAANTGIYWALWLMFIIALVKIISKMTQNQLNYILRNIPYILLLATVLLYIILFPHLNRSLPTKNSLGLFAAATLISAMSIKQRFRMVIVACASMFILLASDSRSSLAFGVGTVGLYLISRARPKYSFLYIIALVAVLAFQQPLYNLVEEKMLKKELYATNLDQAIESAQKERTDLLIAGWQLFKERPLEGFGLKTKYYEGRLELTPGASVHVHNGYLGTLIETGLLISLVVLLFVIKIIVKIFKLILVASKDYDKIWLFFIVFGFIRSYGENYLFFNIGNVFSIIFIFLCLIILFGGKRLSLLPLIK